MHKLQYDILLGSGKSHALGGRVVLISLHIRPLAACRGAHL